MLIDGQRIAQQIYSELPHPHPRPCLNILQIGHHKPSEIYIRNKIKACTTHGYLATLTHLPIDAPLSQILKTINSANQNPSIHGILPQLPFPDHLDRNTILAHINPRKDVDCLTPTNLAQFYLSPSTALLPPTTAAILEVCQDLKFDPQGKHIVVLGHGLLVGKPTAIALATLGSTISVGNHHTSPSQFAHLVSKCDMLISATGSLDPIALSLLPTKCVVLDAGIHRTSSNKTRGDLYTSKLDPHFQGPITPVPGGLGPITVACLIKNLVKIARDQI